MNNKWQIKAIWILDIRILLGIGILTLGFITSQIEFASRIKSRMGQRENLHCSKKPYWHLFRSPRSTVTTKSWTLVSMEWAVSDPRFASLLTANSDMSTE